MSTRIRAAVVLSIAAVAIGCSDPNAPTRTADARPGIWFPWFPCVDTIFKATFSLDSLFLPPGPPEVGSWTLNQAAGVVRVVPASGGLVNKPVELRQASGVPGGVGLYGRVSCVFPPASGHATVYWRSMVRSPTASFGTIVLRDNSSRILGWLGYYPGGVVRYNGLIVPGVFWVQNLPQLWRVDVDLTAHTTKLLLNNVVVLPAQPYFQAAATNLWQISFELGTTSSQMYAWDDIQIVVGP